MGKEKYEDALLQSISILAEQAVKKAGYDKTIRATVVKCMDPSIEQYKVRYQDSFYYAYGNGAGVNYPNGANVYVLVPKGDMSQLKTILGTVQKLGINYVNPVSEENKYEQTGSNIVTVTSSEKEFGLCSYKKDGDSIVLYGGSNNQIEINNNNLKYYLQTASHLCCAFDIRTSLNPQQRFNGKYGIRFTIDYNDTKNSSNKITQTHVVDIDVMEGNPYYFEKAVSQKIFMEIDTANFEKITKVQLFSEGFPNENNENNDKDIFFSNLSFQGMKMLTQEEMDTVALSLIARKGYIFEENSKKDDVLPIEAVVRAAGKVVNNSIQSLKYYWFKKNVTITASDVYYCKQSGQGWKCLNDFKIISSEGNIPTKIEYNPAGPILNISRASANIKENKYKCVVVYGNASYSKEFTILTKNADYTITITSDKGTVFESGWGEPQLTCNINPSNPNFIYHWTVTDQVGVSESLKQTGKTIKRKIQEIIGFNKISCTVTTQQSEVIGTAEITLVNKKTSDGGFKLVIVNGQQVFNYNEQGISPCKNKLIEFVIPQLSFILYDKMGKEVDQSLIKKENITWKRISDSNIINSLTAGENGHSYTADYTIHDYFQSNVGNDNIELTVNYAGYRLVATTNFIFTQQGYSGTNGTGMVAVIKVNYKNPLKDNNHVPVLSNIANDTNFTNLTAGLYRNGEQITTDITYSWRVLKNRQDNTYININPTSGSTVTITKKNTPTISRYENPFSNIVQVQIIHDKKNYFATLPIITTENTNGYYIYLEENSGYNEVLYAQDGLYPKYTKKSFIFKVKDRKGNDVTNSTNFTYYADDNNLLKKDNTNLSACKREPTSTYDGENVSKYIRCEATINNDTLWINIPIYQHLNLYGHSALNGWNGNSIQLNENDNGKPIILTPQIGAGKKEGNTFTGMMMGTVRHYKDNSAIDETGLFGYKKGARSIFLDADTGNATFGIQGNGQIEITPDKGTITGGGYKNDNTTGMLIDLATPQIKFGSGKFSVNSAGELTAQGGGSIAGWHIGPSALTKDTVGMNSLVANDKKNKAFWAGETENNKNNAPFSVDFNGNVVMTSAQIGIQDNNNKKDTANIFIKNGRIYTEGHEHYKDDKDGFYIGPYGIKLGGTFSVSKEGVLTAQKGYIGNSTEGFWINNNAICTKGKTQDKKVNGSINKNGNRGIRITPTSISLGRKAEFYVDDTGSLTAIKGKIANWYITENSISNIADNEAQDSFYKRKAKRDAKGNPIKDTNGNYIYEYLKDGNGRNIVNHDNKNQIYFGKGGIRLGEHFHIDSNGNLYANNGYFDGQLHSTKGNIAGWDITKSALKAGNMEIRSDGAIKHTGGKWNINNTGVATFTDINITGGSMSGGTIGGKADMTGGTISGATRTGGTIKGGTINGDDVTIHYDINGKTYNTTLTKFCENVVTKSLTVDEKPARWRRATVLTSAKQKTSTPSVVKSLTVNDKGLVTHKSQGDITVYYYEFKERDIWFLGAQGNSVSSSVN